MSRKDFIVIAGIILGLDVTPAQRQKIAEQFANELRSTNGQFKRELFIQAATGVAPLNARVPR